VIASVNLQHIEERRAEVERITGKAVAETVPLSFVNTADEIEVVDAPPEMCLEREADSGEADGPALDRQQQLSELREIALLLAADVVDRQLESYLKRHSIEPLWGVQERILVYVTPRANAARMIESGCRNADRFHGELFVVYLDHPDLAPEERARLESSLALARRLGAQVEPLDGEDPVETIMRFARARGITQIFVARSAREDWWSRLWGGDVDRLIRSAEGIDVRVFPH
jgi:two-component system, OmpR family, sensor histidine kinase KdpD